MKTNRDVYKRIIHEIESFPDTEPWEIIFSAINNETLSDAKIAYLINKIFKKILFQFNPSSGYTKQYANKIECIVLSYTQYDIDKQQYSEIHKIMCTEFENILVRMTERNPSLCDISVIETIMAHFKHDINEVMMKNIIQIGLSLRHINVNMLFLGPKRCIMFFISSVLRCLNFSSCIEGMKELVLLCIDVCITRDAFSESLYENPYFDDDFKKQFEYEVFRARNYQILVGKSYD